MQNSKNNKSLFFNFFILFFVQFSFGQLSSFTLNVVPTHETCTGNGALNFNVSGTVSGSTMDFAVYLLPNLTTPLTTVTATSLTGLNSGNYRVVATQSLGGSSASKQQDVTINNAILPLSYTLSGIKVKCGNDGLIQVNVSAGSPVSYQILSGPVTTSQQSSNVFNGLPTGVYQIRVFDSCGEAVVQTYTLLQESVSLIVDPVVIQTTILPTCNTILVTNFFGVLSGSIIAYPLTFNYVVYPPSGSPISYSQTINSGSIASLEIPFFNDQSYYYNLQVIDACGNVYNRNNNIINRKFDFTVNTNKLNCTDLSLQIIPEFYVAPYTINFLSFPAGFNPNAFNSNHPGPFTGIFETYGGVGNSFPVGNYTIQMTDSCGRSITRNITVSPQNPTPTSVGSNNGCGHITILLEGNYMVSVVITNAPSAYTQPLPQNVSTFLNTGGSQFFISNLPVGTYTFQVTDNCGIVSTVNATVSPYSPTPLSIVKRPGCEVGFGSVIVNDTNSISSAILIAAPSSFTGTLPLNLSTNIVLGTFYFGSVPQGSYTFQFTSACGGIRTSTIVIEGYQVTTNTVNITENCGSFNLYLQHLSNGIFSQSYWLQKLNPVTGQWTHPGTGSVYVDGTDLTSINARLLTNNTNNINLAYTGQFRVVKMYRTLVDSNYISCISVINEFEFTGGPKITNVYAFLCSANNNEVVVEATGLPPLQYSITTKNGVPFVVNNGNNNSFTNLESAIYNFQVQDVCGNIVNSVFDVTTLAPFAVEATPFCNGQVGSLSVPLFSFLTYEWWKGTATTTILSTSNSLTFSPFNAATDFGTYHVRIINTNNSSSCVDNVLDYVIPNNSSTPNAGIDGTISYCGNQGSIDLFSILSGTFDNTGTWSEITSSGTLVNNLWNSSTVAPGNYQFKYRVDGLCDAFDESFVNVTINEIPQSPIPTVDAVICDGTSLQLYASTIPGVTYEWVGPNGFSSNVQNPIINGVSSINNGTYSVKVFTSTCESTVSTVEVLISTLPQFSLDFDCIENVATLTATTLNNSFNSSTSVYNWTNADGFSSSENPINITGEEKGIYTLTVTNDLGCSATETIEVKTTLCKIPKGISPNTDGDNDEFDLSGFDGVQKVKIFNRYGMTVFEQDNYSNQWKGQDKNGNILPSGTYYYFVTFANGEPKTGWVYLSVD